MNQPQPKQQQQPSSSSMMQQQHYYSLAMQQQQQSSVQGNDCWRSSNHHHFVPPPPTTTGHHYLSRTVSNASSSTETHHQHHYYSSQQQQTTAPSNKRQRLHRKQVRFASTSDLFLLPTKSSQDLQSSWYTEDDFTNSKRDLRYCSKVIVGSSSCVVDVMECIAYSLATTSTTNHLLLQTLKTHLHPHERILTRGIEHTVSPTVLKLLAHRRKVVIRKIVRESGRLRQQLRHQHHHQLQHHQHHQQQQHQLGRNHPHPIMGDTTEMEWRAFAQYSRENTAFAREWAVLKLLDD